MTDETLYEVEKVCGMRFVGDEVEYLLKWKGYPPSQNSWESEHNLSCPGLVAAFLGDTRDVEIRHARTHRHFLAAHGLLPGYLEEADGGSSSAASHQAEAADAVAAAVAARKRKRLAQQQADMHAEVCSGCGLGGELLCCDTCTVAYHVDCADPPVSEVPNWAEEWRCALCLKPAYRDAREEARRLVDKGGRPEAEVMANTLFEYGLCEPAVRLPAEACERLRAAVSAVYGRILDTVQRLGKQGELRDVGYVDLKTRSEGRFDVRLWPMSDSVRAAEDLHEHDDAVQALVRDGPWRPLVERALGDDCRALCVGAIVAQPGAVQQPPHSDGDHLSDEEMLPPHCLNVFVPLDDFTAANGATQFWPASHLLLNWYSHEMYTPTPSAGGCVVMDYRVKHRGGANQTGRVRTMLYVTYSKPTFVDQHNFSLRRYARTPVMLERAAGREARRGARADAAADDSDKG